jgi:hypothetical protein
VDVQPGGGPFPGPAAAEDGVVVLEPRIQPHEPPTFAYPLVITGYARTFEANVIARLRTNSDVEAETFTTAAAWAEAWGEFVLEVVDGPAGAVELFVGELSARDGTEQGVRLDIQVEQQRTEEDEAFLQFARDLDQALQQGQVDFLIDRLHAPLYTCRPEDLEPRPGSAACEFAGQQFHAFELARWRSHGALAPVQRTEAQLRSFIESVLPAEEDQYGSGQPRVYAVGMEGEMYHTVITALIERPPDFAGSGPLRVALVLPWEEKNGAWLAQHLLVAFVLAEDFLDPTEAGREYVPGWERLD